jgi:hypothetical protein
MRNLMLIALLALAVPTFALAAKPPAPGAQSHSQAAPKVLYILKGTLSAYSNPGSVTIHVTSANHYRADLKGKDLTFAVDSSTKVAVSTGSSVTVGHKGIVKVKAAKKIALADLLTTLQAQKASQVIDQGAAG